MRAVHELALGHDRERRRHIVGNAKPRLEEVACRVEVVPPPRAHIEARGVGQLLRQGAVDDGRNVVVTVLDLVHVLEHEHGRRGERRRQRKRLRERRTHVDDAEARCSVGLDVVVRGGSLRDPAVAHVKLVAQPAVHLVERPVFVVNAKERRGEQLHEQPARVNALVDGAQRGVVARPCVIVGEEVPVFGLEDRGTLHRLHFACMCRRNGEEGDEGQEHDSHHRHRKSLSFALQELCPHVDGSIVL